MAGNPKDAAVDMAAALKAVFKRYTLSSRRRAWKALARPDGSKEVMKLVLHPTKPLTAFRKLSFREWIEIHFFLAYGYLIVAALFVEKNPFSATAFALTLKISCLYTYWFSSGPYFLITVALKSLKIRSFKSSNFVFLIQSCSGYLGPFAFLFEFRISF